MKDCLNEAVQIDHPVLTSEEKEARKLQISKIARTIIFGSVDDAKCKEHRIGKCKKHTEEKCENHIKDQLQKQKNVITEEIDICNECRTIRNSDHNDCEHCEIIKKGFNDCEICQTIKERVESYNNHSCSFTCHKKKKTMSIKPDEGHGRLDGKKTGPMLKRRPKIKFHSRS